MNGKQLFVEQQKTQEFLANGCIKIKRESFVETNHKHCYKLLADPLL